MSEFLILRQAFYDHILFHKPRFLEHIVRLWKLENNSLNGSQDVLRAGLFQYDVCSGLTCASVQTKNKWRSGKMNDLNWEYESNMV